MIAHCAFCDMHLQLVTSVCALQDANAGISLNANFVKLVAWYGEFTGDALLRLPVNSVDK